MIERDPVPEGHYICRFSFSGIFTLRHSSIAFQEPNNSTSKRQGRAFTLLLEHLYYPKKIEQLPNFALLEDHDYKPSRSA